MTVDLFVTPTRHPAPAVDPRVHLCATCGKPGAQFGQATQWYCREHVPANFLPKNRGQG